MSQSFERKDIALRQLETALRLFEEGDDLFSVVTLAGAAEEIFGKLLEAKGEENHFEALTNGAVAVHRALYGEAVEARVFVERANRARNAFKHYTPGESTSVTLDPREEAIDMLDRGVTNYWRLDERVLPAMQRFMDTQRAAP